MDIYVRFTYFEVIIQLNLKSRCRSLDISRYDKTFLYNVDMN